MTITIFFNNNSKQVIKTSEKFSEKKTYGEQYMAAQAIAHDISKGSYEKFTIND